MDAIERKVSEVVRRPECLDIFGALGELNELRGRAWLDQRIFIAGERGRKRWHRFRYSDLTNGRKSTTHVYATYPRPPRALQRYVIFTRKTKDVLFEF